MSEKVKGVLKSVSSTVKSLVNQKGETTNYRTCTVEINNKVYFAKIWEKSVPNAVVNETYDVELREDGENVWLTVLTGVSANIATKADFAEFFSKI